MEASPSALDLESLVAAAARPGRLALLLDFDGTLSEIVPRPADARARPGALEALARLVRGGVDAAIVSGRKLDDLAPRVPLEGVWLVGQHGAELRDHAGRFTQLVAPEGARPTLERFVAGARTLAGARGLLIEDKGLAVAVHLRGLPDDEARQLEHALAELARSLCAGGRVGFQTGKCLVEVRALGADKGRAAAVLLEAWESAPGASLAVGDDTTDEDMFREVSLRGGLAIKVGAGPSAAPHRLESPADLERFLVRLAERRGPAFTRTGA